MSHRLKFTLLKHNATNAIPTPLQFLFYALHMRQDAIYSNIQFNINEVSVPANKAFGKCGHFKEPNRHYTFYYES
jgi:hypothetical protein